MPTVDHAIHPNMLHISDDDFWSSTRVPRGETGLPQLREAIRIGKAGDVTAWDALAAYHTVNLKTFWQYEYARLKTDPSVGNATVDEMIDRYGSIESGRRRAAFEEVALDDVVRDVTELYEPLAEEKEQKLDVRMPEPVTVSGDRDLLFQAFANLLDNAIKYTPEGGDIHVSLENEAGGPRIRIVDSGPGIPEASRDQVFKRFYRMEESRHTPGNGLGLSLVEAVARLHKADIDLGGEPGLDVSLAFPRAA